MKPDVAKLRQTILQLAIEGKLVAQNPEDESVDVLIEKIDSAKQILVEQGLIRKTKELEAISENEMYSQLPSSWEWVRLGNIGELNPRNPVIGDDQTVSFAPMEVIPERLINSPNYKSRKWGEVKKGYTHFAEGDVLLAKVTPCFENGKSCVAERLEFGFGAGTTELHVFRGPNELVIPQYIYYLFNTPHFRNSGKQAMTGVAGLQRVPKDTVNRYPVPLPPVEEQKRIVEKVEALMALCDELDNKSDSLVNTLDKLRRTIFQLAIEGKVTSQDSSEESVDNLLERIATGKELPAITENEMRLDIPSSWEWIRIGQIATVKGGKRVPKGEKLTSSPTDHIYIRVTDMTSGSVDKGNLQYIDDDTFEKISRYTISAEDVYITIAGTIGRVGTIPAELDGSNLTENAAKLVFEEVDKRYLVLALSSSHIQSQFSNRTIQAAQPKLALKRIELTTLPLPPIEEQKRIVSKVDELMSLCDELEMRLMANPQ